MFVYNVYNLFILAFERFIIFENNQEKPKLKMLNIDPSFGIQYLWLLCGFGAICALNKDICTWAFS